MTHKKVVVVAAGNSELGQSLIEQLLLKDDHIVAATYRNKSEQLFKIFSARQMNPNAYCVKTDLVDSEQIAKMFEVFKELGQIWGVVNFAGEATGKRLHRTPQAETEKIVLNNLMPAINLTAEYIKYLSSRNQTGGRIVQVSSITVRRPVPGTIPYVIAKSGIEGLVKSSAEELGRFGVTINALRLGYFDRGMAKRDVPSEFLELISKSTASHTLGQPENLYSAVRYLLSEESGFQTGAVIDLDGGLF